jgi:hypothetical protein
MDGDLVIGFASNFFYPNCWSVLFAYAAVCFKLSVIRPPYLLVEERLEPFFHYLKRNFSKVLSMYSRSKRNYIIFLCKKNIWVPYDIVFVDEFYSGK